ncbi:HD-GYP domain-containing protein [Thalassotalea sp. LPB0316]|uniref:HD-GYP domain-containing protein n=1 Tax=Thalassotalea sp. LPB0316 TaxID=2769490 RepID=UPI00186889F1|nr:HD-GYP domain-containing protein [Thalassotalea sp. LPB0316]QOL26728.1 HD-GYP domain-containing protein [Thalassotalea sp. LPB0316]
MIIEKQLPDLTIGEYVIDIVQQKGTYTLTSAGHIKTPKVITLLANKGVISVLVDTDKALKTKTSDEDSPDLTPPDKKPQSPVIVEIKKAKKIFNESKNIQRQILKDVAIGKEINVEPIIDITNNTIDTVFKNPDALACVINIRDKDEYLLEHSVSVSILMTIFARYLGFDKPLVQQLTIGAFLHDVGKIKIDDNILHKPGKLTAEEFDVMKTHVNHSIDIISQTQGVSELSLEVAALHHERLNGTGYPYNIQAQDISKYGRMVSICDIFDALTADRCYKDGYPHIKAFSILRKLAQDEHLDAQLVDQFIKCMGVYPVGSLVELNSHKLAIVEARNQADPIRPKVRSFFNVDDNRYVMTEDIDLTNTEDFIVKGVKADDFDLDMNKIIEFLLMQG